MKKPIGTIYNKIRLSCNVSILNGCEYITYNDVPLIFLDYIPDESDCSDHKFKFWLKLEGFGRIEEQYNKNLKELSVWLSDEQTEKLYDFLSKKFKREKRKIRIYEFTDDINVS